MKITLAFDIDASDIESVELLERLKSQGICPGRELIRQNATLVEVQERVEALASTDELLRGVNQDQGNAIKVLTARVEEFEADYAAMRLSRQQAEQRCEAAERAAGTYKDRVDLVDESRKMSPLTPTEMQALVGGGAQVVDLEREKSGWKGRANTMLGRAVTAEARVVELESRHTALSVLLFTTAQASPEQLPPCGVDTLVLATQAWESILVISDQLAEHFGDDNEHLGQPYGDVYDAIKDALGRLITRVSELEAERLTPAIAPNPFRLNPVDGTMGYVLVLATYSGELDEWVLEDDGKQQGWRTASLIETTVQLKEPDQLPKSLLMSCDFSGMSAICHNCGAGQPYAPFVCPGRTTQDGEKS